MSTPRGRSRPPSVGRNNLLPTACISEALTAPQSHSKTKFAKTLPSILSFLEPEPIQLPFFSKEQINCDPTIPPMTAPIGTVVRNKHRSYNRKDAPFQARTNLSCPESWLKASVKPTWLENCDNYRNYDEKEKEAYASDFVSRNKHQLWKFDPNYLSTMNTKMESVASCDTLNNIVHDMIARPDFIQLMRVYDMRERALKLNSSGVMEQCITDKLNTRVSNERHLNHRSMESTRRQKDEDILTHDPSIRTLHTSQQQRQEKKNFLFQPSTYSTILTKHRKGYNHTAEYGTFSGYCAVLKANEGSTMNR